MTRPSDCRDCRRCALVPENTPVNADDGGLGARLLGAGVGEERTAHAQPRLVGVGDGRPGSGAPGVAVAGARSCAPDSHRVRAPAPRFSGRYEITAECSDAMRERVTARGLSLSRFDGLPPDRPNTVGAKL